MLKYLHSELEELGVGGDVETPELKQPYRTRLHRAMADGDLARVKLLLADVKAEDSDGQHLMHIIVEASADEEFIDEQARAEMIELLLAAGADPNARDTDEDTPLSLAYQHERPYCVRALVEAGADPNISGKRGAPTPPFVFNLIRSASQTDVVANVLTTAVDVDARDNRGHTHLDRAAFCGSPLAVRALLDAGANANAATRRPPLCSAGVLMKNNGGEEAVVALSRAGANVELHSFYDKKGPLHHAVKCPSLAAIRLLLEHGADLNSTDDEGQTPLCDAVKYARDDNDNNIINLLLGRGANVNDEGARPLHAASKRGHASTVRLLLKSGVNLRLRNQEGETALHAALKRDCAATVSALLEAGADPNAEDRHGETPLHYAVQRCSPSITQLLLNAGANPDPRDVQGRTPLFYATLDPECNTHWAEHVTVLLEAGANIDSRDIEGVTALHHAVSTQSLQATCLLLGLGADPCAGPAAIPISPHFVIDLIGKAGIEAILAIVTRGRLQSDGISSEQDQCISPLDLSQLEKEECEVLVRTMREQMFKQPPSERKGSIALLSRLYAMLGYYPSGSVLDECEVSLPKGRPSRFGGFADCWKGSFLGCYPVAMKSFRTPLAVKTSAKHLAREARVWNHLIHPNVLPFLGVCTLDSVPYLISPWMENGHALDYVKEHPNADPLRLLVEIANGVNYLHTFKPKPVIHGDLRGPNILISLSGNARIADFGLSELKVDAYDTNYSTPFVVAGHPRWKAPELVRAENGADARRNTTTDVFAFGRVMLELFTGKIPFSDLDEAMVIVKVWGGELPQRPCDDEVIARGLDDSMWQLMTDCWQATPSERPSAAHLGARLTAVLESRGKSKPLSSEKVSFKPPMPQGANPSSGAPSNPVPLRTLIEMVRQAGMDIVPLVLRSGIDMNELGHRINPSDLNDFEKKGCEMLMRELRKKMLAHTSPTRDVLIKQLSQLYDVFRYYPADIALDECEVVLSKDHAPRFNSGFANFREGTFLGCHRVSMRSCHHYHEEQARLLAQGMKVWSQLHHPNVLPFLGSYKSHEMIYLVSPWMENGNALEFVQRHPDADCLRLLLQVASGLEYLHGFEPAVIHGDLRGSNILISELGDAHIGNFGLSEFKIEESSPTYSTPWLVAGHLRWQAPEIINAKPNEARRNMKTDVFAFGRVMLELLTQAVPFSSTPLDFKVMLEVMKGSFPSRPRDAEVVTRGLDDEAWKLMTECWNVDASRRPCASDLVARLRIATGTRGEREASSRPKKRLRISERVT